MEIQESSTFIHNLYHSDNNKILRDSAEKLGVLTEPDIEVILALIYLLNNNNDELVKWKAIRSLGYIATDNLDTIEALINVIVIGRIPSRYLAAESLSKIAVGNEKAIISLTNLIYKTEDTVTLNCASNILGCIAKDNQNAIDALVYLLNKMPNYNVRLVVAQNINSITEGHPKAVSTWLDIIRNEDRSHILNEAISCLSQVSVGDEFVIKELKKIKKVKGNDESIVNRRKIAKRGLWEIDNNWFKKILTFCGYILFYMALPLFFIFAGVVALYLWFYSKFFESTSTNNQ